jgi:hypothetical protein
MATRSMTKRNINNNKTTHKPSSVSTDLESEKDKENSSSLVLPNNKRKEPSPDNECLKVSVEERDDVAEDEGEADDLLSVEQLKEKIFDLRKKLKDKDQQLEKLKSNYDKALKIIQKNKYVEVEGEFNQQEISSSQCHDLIRHVKEKIFPKVKVVNTAILDSKPEILASCHRFLQISKVAEQQMLRKSIETTIKYTLAQKRRYCKDKLMTAYQGTIFIVAFHFAVIRIFSTYFFISNGLCLHVLSIKVR